MLRLAACFLGCFTFLLILDYGLAIKCYVCNSYFLSTCGDAFDNKTYKLQQCEDGVTMCRKIVQEVYFNDEWDIRYIRQCAPTGIVGAKDGRECLERTGTYRVKMKYCHCDNRNGCNDASDVSMSRFLMTLPSFSLLWIIIIHL